SRFAEALASLKRGHGLGTKRPGWPYPSAKWVRDAERLAALEAKLPDVLKGELTPEDTGEYLVLVAVCQAKKLHHAATRLYADAFAAGLAQTSKRCYDAAACAVLAADGQGNDAAKLQDKEKAALRQQALGWLKAALKIYRKHLEDEGRRPQVRQTLQHWQK